MSGWAGDVTPCVCVAPEIFASGPDRTSESHCPTLDSAAIGLPHYKTLNRGCHRFDKIFRLVSCLYRTSDSGDTKTFGAEGRGSDRRGESFPTPKMHLRTLVLILQNFYRSPSNMMQLIHMAHWTVQVENCLPGSCIHN